MAWVMSDEEHARIDAWESALRKKERLEAVEHARRMIRRAERSRDDAMTPAIRDLRRMLDGLVKRVRAAA